MWGHFVAHAHSPDHDYACGICMPPSRAGKTRKRREREAAIDDCTMPRVRQVG
nr:FlhC family transcriptional regulator [Halomonas tianxiuensis]